ncbi:MAG: NADH-quinone oxidoreductase subunit [Chloroflexota bacterium]|jgi:NADH-quinone oxidoreductase subunit L|nr:NADH-quinone oxidoreductase subunit [Chloroflexota bacterium]
MGTLLVLGLVLPLFGFGLNRFFGSANRPGVRVMGPVAILAAFTCFAVAAVANGGGHVDFVIYRWFEQPAGPVVGIPVPAVDIDLYLDPLSAVMTLVITGVGFLIHAYASVYMDEEGDMDYARFFAHMNLFVFSMLLLVLARNFVVLTIGWAMVGLSSYLLIGFYHRRPAAVLAARKAFVMNVIGDVGIVIASLIALRAVGSISFDALFAAGPICGGTQEVFCKSTHFVSAVTLEAIAFFLLVGAVAKSAQVPLHTWLPDAMEGPTPVSALIHAATMVTAGVYLIARMHPLFVAAPGAAGTAAFLGAATALMAAILACVQTDIKRVLAYSTMSQVGYMFFAVAIGAEAAGIFHLVTHAFFKALLFLAAGNIIHALGGEQDMRRMGGLWTRLTTTRWLFLIGSFALAGLMPLSGFFSKDEIIAAGFTSGPLHPLGGIVLLAVAGLTAYYTLRAFLVVFMGQPLDAERHVHEADPGMIVPVVVLAVLASFGGLIQPGFWHLLGDYLGPAVGAFSEAGAGIVLLTAALSTAAVLGGMFLAYGFFSTNPRVRASRPVNPVLAQAFLWDRAYSALVVNPLWAFGGGLDRLVESPLVIGVTDLAARASLLAGQQVRRAQSGYLRSYAMLFAAAALVVVVIAGMGVR